MVEFNTPIAKYNLVHILELPNLKNILANPINLYLNIKNIFKNFDDIDCDNLINMIFECTYVVIIDVHKGTLNMNDTGCNFIIPAMQLELQAHRSIVTKEYPSIVGDSINLLPYIKYNDTLHFNPLSINAIVETFFSQFDF